MLVNLVGVKNISKFETSDGKTIEGVKLFLAYADENTYGNMTDSKFISNSVFQSFGIELKQLIYNIGCCIDVEFNPKQKIVGIKFVESTEKKG